MNVVGVILAGGQSRRMGGSHKSMIELKSKSLFLHVLDRLSLQTEAIVLNINTQEDSFKKFKLPIIKDSITGYMGPLAGVLAGMDWAYENRYQYILTVAVDTPFFPKDFAKKCKKILLNNNCSIVLASTVDNKEKSEIIHPTFGMWDVSLRNDLRKSLESGTRKMVAWTDKHQVSYCKFLETKFNPFFNINNPDDLRKAETIIEKGWV